MFVPYMGKGIFMFGPKVLGMSSPEDKPRSVYRDKVLTPEQLKEYILANGDICPHCHSKDIESMGDPSFVTSQAEPLEIDGAVNMGKKIDSYIEHLVGCNACGAEWRDIYRISGVRELKVKTTPSGKFITED